MKLTLFIIAATAALLTSCGSSSKAADAAAAAPTRVETAFSADSAYAYVAQQVAFGPRVPGSKAAQQCAAWIVQKLEQFGASDIKQQRAQLTAWNGDKLDINNISAEFNPAAMDRILLLAHWDSRPWADHDADPAMKRKAIDGANDGASGVAVILEIARNLAAANAKTGVDVLFVDAEDYGRHADEKDAEDDELTWCMGTQYWLEHPTLDLNAIRYAILLDMVGGKDAVFQKEYISQYAAAQLNDQIWNQARKMGYAERFPDAIGGAVVDDHLYLLRAGIPAIDIIESAHPSTGSFNPTWHTQADNLENIDKQTMKAVGDVVLAHIKNKK